jgi:hypothetical protein
MKQEILCAGCALEARDRFPTNTPYPGEGVKFEAGLAKKELTCDYCSKRIQAGHTCVAFSTFSDDLPYHPWEFIFITLASDPAFRYLANLGKGAVDQYGR